VAGSLAALLSASVRDLVLIVYGTTGLELGVLRFIRMTQSSPSTWSGEGSCNNQTGRNSPRLQTNSQFLCRFLALSLRRVACFNAEAKGKAQAVKVCVEV
jgi:hypothetical protein